MKKMILTSGEKTIIITIDELDYKYTVITRNVKMTKSARDLNNLGDIIYNCYGDCVTREFDKYYFDNFDEHEMLKYQLDKMVFCKKWVAIYRDDIPTAKHYYRLCSSKRIDEIINTNISVDDIKYHDFTGVTDICKSVKVEY